MDHRPPSPGSEVVLFDNQSVLEIDLHTLGQRTRSALPRCLASPGPHSRPLADLASVEVSFVDDHEIARIHEEFMGIPGATDVITFDHGEIVISVETASRYAAEHRHPLDRELTLYIIHGLLHLNGYEDATPGGFEAMRRTQEGILEAILAG